MTARIRAHDWAATSLGAIETWPQSLRTALDLVLVMHGPATILWGPDSVQLYNDAYVSIAKDRHPALLGRSVEKGWPDAYDEVIVPLLDAVRAGQATHLADFTVDLQHSDGSTERRAFDTDWSPIRDESGAVAGALQTLTEVTERHRIERQLRESEARQTLLLRLSDNLRGITDQREIQRIAMRLLGEHLGLSRTYYFDVVRENGGWVHVIESAYQRESDGPDMVGRHNLKDFGDEMFEGFARGEVIAAADVETLADVVPEELASYRALGVTAFINVPLLRNGEYSAGIGAHDTAPHVWTEAEIALIREVAERTWAIVEHARAQSTLRESEERFQHVVRATRDIVWDIDLLADRVWWSDALQTKLGFSAQEIGPDTAWCFAHMHPDDRERVVAGMKAAAAGTGTVWSDEFRYRRADDTYAHIADRGFITRDPSGRAVRMTGAMQDVTARKEAEAALRESEERQAFLLTLSDTLRTEADARAVAMTSVSLLADHLRLDRAYVAQVDKSRDLAEIGPEYRRPDLAPVEGRLTLADFPEAFARVEAVTLVLRDAAADPTLSDLDRRGFAALEMGALMVASARRGANNPVWALLVATKEPRCWTTAEVALVEDVAERTWAAVERVRTEAALRFSEQRFREFGENSSDALWIIDAETRQLDYVSPAFERIWGESREAVMADLSRWAELAHPDDRAAASQALLRLLAGEAFVADYRIIRPDGEVRWIRDTGFPMKEGGVVRRGGGIAQDVTELKRAETALRVSEERFRQFGEASLDVLWIRDAETLQWQYLTPAFEGIYGMSREEALAGDNYRSWLDLIVPEDRPGAIANIERVRGGEHVVFEYRVRRPRDGTIRWLRNTDFPITDETGRVKLVGGIGHDMTELREAELRLEALVEGIPQLVWRAVDGGHWTWASPQWTAYTGQSEPDSHDWGWLDPLHPDDRALAQDAWSCAVDTGVLEVEYRVCHAPEHRYRWFQTRATPVRDQSGTIVEWLGTSTDVDDLRAMQDRQQVMVAELQHRTRNLIAVVRSIARQTMGASEDLEDFRDAFNERLAALSRVQGLLSRSEQERITIEALLRIELDALGAREVADRVRLTGPEVPLRNSIVQTMALALHELATNARKYGALADGHGRLDVSWDVRTDARERRRLAVTWLETGVDMGREAQSPVSQPGGYGRELIERALPYALGAKTTYQMAADGVRCTIDLPLDKRPNQQA